MVDKKALVSYKLLEKRQIEELLVKLIKETRPARLPKIFDPLLDLPPEAVFNSSLAKLEQIITGQAETKKPFVAVQNLLELISMVDVRQKLIIEKLVFLVKNNKPATEVKMILLSFIAEMGCPEEQLAQLIDFDELEAMKDSSVNSLLSLVGGSLEEQLTFIEEISSFEPELQEELFDYLAQEGSEKAIEILGYLAYSPDRQVSSAAILALGRAKHEAARATLQELARISNPEVVSQAKKQLKKVTKTSGLPTLSQEWTSPLGELHDVIVSSSDGRGNIMVWLLWQRPKSKTKLMGMHLLIDIDLGIKDYFASFDMTKKKVETELKKMAKEAGVLRGDYEFALGLIRHSLSRNQTGILPVPAELAFWNRCLQGEIYPKPYPFKFDSLLSKPGKLTQELVERLFFSKEFTGWFEEEPEIYDIAEKVINVKTKYGDKPIADQRIANLENKVINQIIAPILDEIINRLEFTIEFLLKTGQAELASDAYTCYLSLKKTVPERNLFIRMISKLSILAAIGNLLEGYDLRDELDEDDDDWEF